MPAKGGHVGFCMHPYMCHQCITGRCMMQCMQACEGCKRRREAMKAAFKNANLSAPPPQQQAVAQQQPQPQH